MDDRKEKDRPVKRCLRKSVFSLLWFIFLFSIGTIAAQEGTVLDKILPGESRRAEMRTLLGNPKTAEAAGAYIVESFDSREYLFQEITLWFDASEILEWAVLRPMHPINAEDAPLLFDLTLDPEIKSGRSFGKAGDSEGETRHYFSQGIHFYINNNVVDEIWMTAADIEIESIQAGLNLPRDDLKSFSDENERPEPDKIDEQKGENEPRKGTPYLGTAFEKHEGEGIKILGILDSTPAQNSGLRKGDIMLEVEDISLRSLGSTPQLFGEKIRELPLDRPVRFHIERDGRQFDVYIKLLSIKEEERADFQREVNERYGSPYSRGQRLYNRGDYRAALESFLQSVEKRPLESYRFAGICLMRLNNPEAALKYIVKAYKMNKKSPTSTFWLAVCCDNMQNFRDAAFYYNLYLKMKHDKKVWHDFAVKRKNELKSRKKGGDTKSTILKILNAIREEIKK